MWTRPSRESVDSDENENKSLRNTSHDGLVGPRQGETEENSAEWTEMNQPERQQASYGKEGAVEREW